MANSDTFEDLECWQACNQLKRFIKMEVLVKLPKMEQYQLYSQLLRASRSATANVAEGWGRYHYKENIKFLLNARGSCAECLDHLLEAQSCDYIDTQIVDTGRAKVASALKLLNGYIRYLRNSIRLPCKSKVIHSPTNSHSPINHSPISHSPIPI